MLFKKAFIPYRGYWSTPFCSWQGSLANYHSLRLLADVGGKALSERGIELKQIEGIHLGTTVPQQKSFFGAPWVAAMMGMVDITGPTLAQACATGARTLCSAASAIELGEQSRVLAAAADRTSNGPQLYYPNPKGLGGHGEQEAWILDNLMMTRFCMWRCWILLKRWQ